MNILVIGGTGTVGSETARRLLERGANVRAMSRSQPQTGSLPVGVEWEAGDLAEPGTLGPAFSGMEGMFLVVPIGSMETQNSLNGVDMAKKSGIQRIVYMSVASIEAGAHIPHFGSKIPVENAVKQSGIPYTILRPNNFYQNDKWFKDAIMSYGIYPQPIGSVGINRVDVRDIADAAVNALTKPGHEGEVYPLNGPDALTGQDVADIYSEHLGHEVRYSGDDLDAWAEQALKMLPDWMVRDYRIMYEHFQTKGLLATTADLVAQRKALGREPRTFDAYVEETISAWKKEGAVVG